MKRFATFLLIISALALTAMSPQASATTRTGRGISTVDQLIERLSQIERYEASATYSVLLPSASDDITYSIEMQSVSTPDDSLSPCDYLIEWSLPTSSGSSEGFSSYTSGNHFRYRDQRLQEYHFDWDSVPFIAGNGGVQRNAQFVDILPQYLALRLKEIASKPEYSYRFNPDTVAGGRHVAAITAVETRRGYVAREMKMLFDNVTGMPLKIETEHNPGAISEQIVSVEYSTFEATPLDRFSEDRLMTRYPEVFEKFRQSNFRVENLPGTDLPPFSLRTITGERYSRLRGEDFHYPVIMVFIDPSVDTAAATVADIRKSIKPLPFNVDIIWAFISNNTDEAERLIGEPVEGETTLMSARSLTRDCGVNSYPTMLFVNTDGKISGVQLGYNKSLPEIVMQKTALMGL